MSVPGHTLHRIRQSRGIDHGVHNDLSTVVGDSGSIAAKDHRKPVGRKTHSA